MSEYDVCVVGSGAGAGPVILELAQAGYQVVVLEKGPWFGEADFYKDELACCRRSVYTPNLRDEQHVLEDQNSDGEWESEATSESGRDFWNGNCVGGSSNFMSGYFHRLKPTDFRLLSEYGEIKGANVVDWPISYEELEPYYAKVETEVGVSGRVVQHSHLEPRSTKDFPYPPTLEHPIAHDIDEACNQLGMQSLPVARAILSRPSGDRRSCEYSGFCGSYGCSSGAKGSARAALLNRAVKTQHCEIRAHAKVHKLISNKKGKVTAAEYFDKNNQLQTVRAKTFVVACQAIETVRLLRYSTGPKHPDGLGNRYQQLGRNLLFSAGGQGGGDLVYAEMSEKKAKALKTRGPFVNRALQEWYEIKDKEFGKRAKGGTVDFLLRHPNAIARAMGEKWNRGQLVWGKQLQKNLHSLFTESLAVRFEVFCDWLPTDNCYVELDNAVKDKWNSPVARVRLGYHEHDLKVGHYIADKSLQVLKELGAKDIYKSISGGAPQNLVAGGCRFGNNPKKSVLDKNCKVHDIDNLYVTDGSFMPTGGSVPYTWTIYANSFRVADYIKKEIA